MRKLTFALCVVLSVIIAIRVYISIADKNPIVIKQFVQHNNIGDFFCTPPDTSIEFKIHEKKYTSPYVLVTKCDWDVVFDFGTFKEIDSIKCIRFTEMEVKAIKIKADMDKINKELELLNKKKCK